MSNSIRDAANNYIESTSQTNSRASFIAGVEWQNEQYMAVVAHLKRIAERSGNLSDVELTWGNDASQRGLMVVDMRQLAVEAIQIIEPDYKLLF